MGSVPGKQDRKSKASVLRKRPEKNKEIRHATLPTLGQPKVIEATNGEQWGNLEASATYPLARNQYINNSPGVFSCILAGANTGAKHAENDSSNFLFCVRASANTGPACIRKKNEFPWIFSCMYWFCAGGVLCPMRKFISDSSSSYGQMCSWCTRRNATSLSCEVSCQLRGKCTL